MPYSDGQAHIRDPDADRRRVGCGSKQQVGLEQCPPDERLYGKPAARGPQATATRTRYRVWQPLRAPCDPRANHRSSRLAVKGLEVEPCIGRAHSGDVCFTRRAGAGSHMGSLPPPPAACLSQRVTLKRPDGLPDSSSRWPSGFDAPAKFTDRRSMHRCSAAGGEDRDPWTQSPVFGGPVEIVDDRAAKSIKACRQIVLPTTTLRYVGPIIWGRRKKGWRRW